MSEFVITTTTVVDVIEHPIRRALQQRRVMIGSAALLLILGACVLTLPWTLSAASALNYERMDTGRELRSPTLTPFLHAFGTDQLGRSLLTRSMVGGVVSLAVGLAAAFISIVLGVGVGLFAGYRGGWIDALLMRSLDIFYGLPYVLLVILFKIALQGRIEQLLGNRAAASMVVLFLAIGLVSWLTMARVVRGQVLSLRGQPFIEAARAMGLPELSIFLRHLLPNLIGPITVYATLTIPVAILQESFLSFLGIGISGPMVTWGSLAKEGMTPALLSGHWWLLVFPCALLAVTLLSLNFLGDGLRDLFDPKRDVAKI